MIATAGSLGGLMSAIAIGRSAFNLIRILAVRRWRNRSKDQLSPTSRTTAEPATICIVIPVLRERSLAGHLASLALSLVQEGGKACCVIVAGTKRETPVEGRTTLNAVARAVSNQGHPDSERIILFEADGSDRCKADQMTQALDWLEAGSGSLPADGWIGVYDADSAPEQGTLVELRTRISRQSHRAYQQPPLYIHGWDGVLDATGGILTKSLLLGRAVYSHLFSYKESMGFILSGTPMGTRLSHFTGHGYFIRVDLWRQAGGFHAPSCDTTLGYQLSLAGEPIGLLFHRDRSQIPSRLGDFVRQTVVWFNGCQLYWRELNRAIESSSVETGRFRTFLRLSGVAARNASWAWLPYLWTTIFLWDFLSGRNLGAWLAAVVSWVAVRGLVWAELVQLRGDSDVEARPVPYGLLMATPLLAPMAVLINGLGPLQWYARRLTGRAVELTKTPRPE